MCPNVLFWNEWRKRTEGVGDREPRFTWKTIAKPEEDEEEEIVAAVYGRQTFVEPDVKNISSISLLSSRAPSTV